MNLNTNSNTNCCGLGEVRFSEVNGYCNVRTVRGQLKRALGDDFTGLHLTQAYEKKKPKWTALEKAVTKLGKRVYLGVNPGSGNHIYSWTIPAAKLA